MKAQRFTHSLAHKAPLAWAANKRVCACVLGALKSVCCDWETCAFSSQRMLRFLPLGQHTVSCTGWDTEPARGSGRNAGLEELFYLQNRERMINDQVKVFMGLGYKER